MIRYFVAVVAESESRELLDRQNVVSYADTPDPRDAKLCQHLVDQIDDVAESMAAKLNAKRKGHG
jgi:hypothetical protein